MNCIDQVGRLSLAVLRRGLPDIVRRTAALEPRPETSLTTNALGLSRTARVLAEAGLDRVNVSLDTVRPADFLAITRRDRLADVVDGLAAASAAGLGPVKVNAVLMRGINDDQSSAAGVRDSLLSWAAFQSLGTPLNPSPLTAGNYRLNLIAFNNSSPPHCTTQQWRITFGGASVSRTKSMVSHALAICAVHPEGSDF